MECIDLTTGQTVANRLSIAATFVKRLVGLLNRSRLDAGEGLLITPCKGVHTMFMRFPIDVVFLDKDRTVIALADHLPPWRQSAYRRGASAVLELPAGGAAAAGIANGHRLDWK